MLSNTADYALRAVLVLARAYGGPPLHAERVAEAIGAPRNYLAKTLNALARTGIVTSTRGPAGGFCLAVPPGELSLARVIDAFDEPRQHSHCLLGSAPCDPERPCAAHHCWSAVLAARRAPLTGTMVADLLGPPAATEPAATEHEERDEREERVERRGGSTFPRPRLAAGAGATH